MVQLRKLEFAILRAAGCAAARFEHTPRLKLSYYLIMLLLSAQVLFCVALCPIASHYTF